MPASSEAADVALAGQEARVDVQSASCDPVATGSHAPAAPKLGVESGKKRKLQSDGRCVQAMQSDGLGLQKTVQDTPDRTSSEEDGRGAVHVDAGLPPKVPVKMAAKAALMSEGIAAGQEENGRLGKTAGVLDEFMEGQQRLDTVKPSKKSSYSKAKRPAAPKKVATKSERVDRRRKRKVDDENEGTGISQSSASMLFQCSCQLLRSQALDYDVRARERVERNAERTKEVENWERKIRALQRELQEYADEESDAGPDESAGMALIHAGPGGSSDGNVAVAATAEIGATGEAASIEASLPPGVLAAETKLQEELRRRTQEVNEFCRSVPGFLPSLDEQTTHRF